MWIVLSNEVGTVLAVYGSALETIATHKGKEIRERTGCAVAMHKGTGTRPQVNQSISMRGAHEWL